jgi:hypothetical protein
VLGFTMVLCMVGLPAAGTVEVRHGISAVPFSERPLGRSSGGVSPTENTAVTPLPAGMVGGSSNGRHTGLVTGVHEGTGSPVLAWTTVIGVCRRERSALTLETGVVSRASRNGPAVEVGRGVSVSRTELLIGSWDPSKVKLKKAIACCTIGLWICVVSSLWQ